MKKTKIKKLKEQEGVLLQLAMAKIEEEDAELYAKAVLPTDEEVLVAAMTLCRLSFTEENHGDDRCCQLGGKAGCCLDPRDEDVRAALLAANAVRLSREKR